MFGVAVTRFLATNFFIVCLNIQSFLSAKERKKKRKKNKKNLLEILAFACADMKLSLLTYSTRLSRFTSEAGVAHRVV